ncbi:11996_t:CDS:2, partial [Entrophospora sp. SA101]
SLDAICSATVVYLAMVDNSLGVYEDVRDLAGRAVEEALKIVDDSDRREKILNILPEMYIGYRSVVGLRGIKALNTTCKSIPNYTQEEVEENLRVLKSKLSSPITDADMSLYDSIKKNLGKIDSSELTWKDPEVSTVLSEDSQIIKNLGSRQKRHFLKPRDNMKCEIPESVYSKCDKLIRNFHKSEIPNQLKNILHDKTWKENETDLGKRVERIFAVLKEVSNNPAFETGESRKEQSEGTYIADVVVPLLRATLEDLPNGTPEYGK